MSTVTDAHPLLAPPAPRAGSATSEPLLAELRALASRHDQCTDRSRQFYSQARKMLGQDRLRDCLIGIQDLARAGEPAGARLLAALLDANPPGALLMPRIGRLTSTTRLVNLGTDQVGEAFLRDWQGRLAELVTAGTARVGADRDGVDGTTVGPADREPLPLLRRTLAAVTPRGGEWEMVPEDLALLAGLIRLEADAYQERVSRLAGVIDPFRVTAVMRALPLLSRADTEIRDLNTLAIWLEAGDAESAFRRQVPTGDDVLDEAERCRFLTTFDTSADLAPLASIYRSFKADPQSIRQLAGPVARLRMLGRALQREGLRDAELDLLDAVALLLQHGTAGQLHLPLTPDLAAGIERILLAAQGEASGHLAGLAVVNGALQLRGSLSELGDRIWRHDLPTMEEMLGVALVDDDDDDAAEADEAADRSSAAVKQMVMNNVGCVSILLGFLRNPKVTAIPGLVADVARRSRSVIVLETIAKDRRLTTGHANQDVPLALLESPVNVPVKTLRKFIQVKYISKTDLRRLSRDPARLRKEVCEEIRQYLDSLS
jgi:hypothetical protein